MEKIYQIVRENIITIILGSVLIIFIGVSIYYYTKYNNYECVENICEQNEIIKENPKIFVDIKGSVIKPGVYEVKDNFIINDVVVMAGGFTKSAYTKNINLSKKISNELVIYVFSKNEYKELNVKNTIVKDCYEQSYDVNECLTSGNSIIKSGKESAKVTKENEQEKSKEENLKEEPEKSNQIININTATIEQLLNIKGIGESKAQSIINYRSEVGQFKNIEEIKNVSGIGDVIYEKIKPFITV